MTRKLLSECFDEKKVAFIEARPWLKVNKNDRAAYSEVVTDRYSMPPMSETMFTLTRKKFGQSFTWEEWYSEFKKGKNIAIRK